MKKYLLLMGWLGCLVVNAQVSEADKSIADQLLQKNIDVIRLTPQDLGNSIIHNTYMIPGSDIRMIYLQQSHLGIPVYNKLHVLAFKNEKAVSVAGHRISSIEQRINGNVFPGIDAPGAVKTALSHVNVSANQPILPVNVTRNGQRFDFGTLGVSSEKIFADLLWFPKTESDIRLAWQVFVAPLSSIDYWLVWVDARTNEVIGKENMTISCHWGPGDHNGHQHTKYSGDAPLGKKEVLVLARETKINWQYEPQVINTAAYRVVRYPAESPIHPGGTPSIHVDPWTLSPGPATTHGWHFDGNVHYDSTRGNNAFAYEDRDNNNLPGYSGLSSTPQPSLTFDFVPDFTLAPTIRTPVPNQQFNTTNLFYWNNLMHDLSYIYGFTETARNYQNDNMGRGGIGGDYVLAEAQDGGGSNNANFSSGVEGTRGRMQMYLWTAPNPDRDGDVDNGIIAHEYGHGISNRMTGTGAGCLSNVEQMGEGWSDYFGLMITHDWATATPNQGFDNPRGIGTYALNQPITGPGIRQYRYTTNMAVNPLTYANLPTVAVPHGVGTIWCTALWDMTWYIIQQAGINPNLFNPQGTGGNSIALKLVIEGLRLQPCSPGFISGRDAILKADTLFFGAQYSCAILEAFARRGMGLGASQGSASIRGDETITFVNGSPVISQHPQNVTICSGNNATFSVTATGANPTYQWQLSIDGGSSFNNIPGATSSSYTATNVTTGMNNYRYRCLVSACPPAATSNAAVLTVANSANITNQPANAAVCENTNTSFSITTTGPTPTYQWQVSTDGGANYNPVTNGAVYSGATTATLSISGVTPLMNGYRYRCVVTSPGCPTPAISNAGILTVNSLVRITTEPQDVSLCTGSSHTFSVTASGSGLSYQWQLSTDGGANFNIIPGATSANYSINSVTPSMFGYQYRVMINGACAPGDTSIPALLRVADMAAATVSTPVTETCSGNNIVISGSTTATTIYQWQVNTGSGFTSIINGTLPNGASYSGATTAVLTIANAQSNMTNYQYRLQVSNTICNTPVSSNSIIIQVRQLPSVTLAAAPLSLLMPGQTTLLTATPSAPTGGILSLNWSYNGNAISNAGNTRWVNVEQVGTYRVRINETWPGSLVCSNQSQEVILTTEASNKLFIFPSPNNGRFTVSYYNSNGASTQRTVTVYDSKGAKVYHSKFTVTGSYTLLPVSISPAQSGIYYVWIGDVNGSRLADGKVLVHWR